MSSYTANELNQYPQRTVPGYAGVRGSATNTATVTVNGNAAWRLGEYFYGGDEADNAASAVMKELDITAVVNPPGTNAPDLVQSVTGRVFVAQSPEAFTHDDDGNLTQDGRFNYTWDGENRLIAVETRDDLPASVPRVKVAYSYDHRSRRIGKVVSNLEGETWTVSESRSFLYDGWNMIRELTQSGAHALTNSFVRGLDLSGTLHGAGGVGGLLAVVQNGETYRPAFDGNGNVMEYISTDGTLVAHYEYSPFGETVVHAGPLADSFDFRFSTKYWEEEAKMYYYGYRFYAPYVGRWMNRDPIGEWSGGNIFLFVGNDPYSQTDVLGLAASATSSGNCCGADVTKYIDTVLSDVGEKFRDLSPKAQAGACQRLINPTSIAGMPGFNNSWDIVPLGKLGFDSNDWQFKSGFPGTGDKCGGTVQYNGQCYQARDVNYLLWGKMMSLCDAEFDGESNAAELLAGASLKHLSSMIKNPLLNKLIWGKLEKTPKLWQEVINEAIAVYEQDAYSLPFALHLAFARKMTAFGGASAPGALYFTHLGFTGAAPSFGASYTMLDLSEGSAAIRLSDTLPFFAQELLEQVLAPSATVSDPSCTADCPLVPGNVVSDTNYENWKWMPFHDPKP